MCKTFIACRELFLKMQREEESPLYKILVLCTDATWGARRSREKSPSL